MLRSRKSRREEPIGATRPSPSRPRGRDDPEHEALLADSVGLALLVVLDTLAPAERLAFVLHDMFALSFEEIAPIVGRSPEAARQLASRARRRVQGAAPIPDAELTRQRKVVAAFLAASRDGDSRRFSRCSTPTSCSEPTRGGASGRAKGGTRRARVANPASPSPGAPDTHNRRS